MIGRSHKFMVGILIVTHGKLAEGFAHSVNMIMGEQEQFQTIGLFPDSDLEKFKDVVKEGMESVDTGEGVLVFVDMFGASPCNFAAANISEFLEDGKKVRVVTGCNLGMLIECINMRNFTESIETLYQAIIRTGKDGILELLETMSTSKED